jgi:hypothetical protein
MYTDGRSRKWIIYFLLLETLLEHISEYISEILQLFQGDGSFWLILSFHVIVTDKAGIIQSIKS